MQTLINYAGLLVCAVVLVGCVCRIDMMAPTLRNAPWAVFYFIYAAFALDTLTELWGGRNVDWLVAAVTGAMALHILLTWRRWPDDTPKNK